jgi:hypothetical protein
MVNLRSSFTKHGYNTNCSYENDAKKKVASKQEPMFKWDPACDMRIENYALQRTLGEGSFGKVKCRQEIILAI